jgi:hypothetical protein
MNRSALFPKATLPAAPMRGDDLGGWRVALTPPWVGMWAVGMWAVGMWAVGMCRVEMCAMFPAVPV